MRPFLLIFLICAVAMQLEAWPWRTRSQRKQAQQQESAAPLEAPSSEGTSPEAQKEGGETSLTKTENPSAEGTPLGEALSIEPSSSIDVSIDVSSDVSSDVSIEASINVSSNDASGKTSVEQSIEQYAVKPMDEAAAAGELAAARLSKENTLAEETPAEKAFMGEKTLVSVIKNPETRRSILGKGETGAGKLVSFFLSENKNADRKFIEELVNHYIAEAEAEGINHDIAFAQMCLETGFLRFGGLVSPEMNNFCGLGSTGPGVPGASFSTAQLGIRAHIQHLQAYATDLPLQGELIDPRYHLVRRGSVPEVQGLAGSWAADRLYAEKIESILGRLYRFEE